MTPLPMIVSTSDPSGLLQFPANRWAKTEQAHMLLLSALQYSLKNSILIASEKDIKCLRDLNVEPYIHQVENLKQFFNNYPQRMMLFDDVGLGKTISAGLILTELIRRHRVSNFLIVCPAILVEQWKQELEEKFRIRDIQAGNWQKLKLIQTTDLETSRIITTYNAVAGHKDFFFRKKWDFVVVDEGDNLKTLYSARGYEPSGRARTFYDLLKSDHAEFFLLLTATPLRKNLWDVFNLAEITAQPGVNPLGTWQSFLRTFIADDPTKARELEKSQQGEFKRRLTEISSRTTRKEQQRQQQLTFPERRVEKVSIPLSEKKKQLLDATLSYLRQRYNFLRKIAPEQFKQLLFTWKSELTEAPIFSWDHLKIASDQISFKLGEYQFSATGTDNRQYTTSLSYELVTQALLAFIERRHPYVTLLADATKLKHFLCEEIEELAEQFITEEVERRRPNKLEEISLLQSVLSSPSAAFAAFNRKQKTSALTKYERDLLNSLMQKAAAIDEPEKAKSLLRIALKLRNERPQDYRLLVFTVRTDTQRFLGAYLEAMGFKDQICYIRGGCPAENRHSQDDFNGARTPNGFGLPRKHILISTDAGSAGVNLQACNVMVNYDLPWVPMTLEQRIGRIQRLGQVAKYVVVYNFYIAQTIDETIVERLLERIQLFELAIGEVEAILQEAEEGGSRSLEEQIFNLIMESKHLRDEEVARRIEQQNRDEAIRQLREEQARNEELLGVLSSKKGTPRFVPRELAPPRLDVRSFCRTAFESLGYRTKYQTDKDVLYVEFKKPTQVVGNWEPYLFTEPDITENGETPKEFRLLAEGTKDFEILLRHMLRQGGVFIRSCEPLEETDDQSCLLALQQEQVVAFRPMRLNSSNTTYRTAWRLTWKITTAIARDRFEKLIPTFPPIEDEEVLSILHNLPMTELEMLPLWRGPELHPESLDKSLVANHLTADVQQDEEILGFEQHYTEIKKQRLDDLRRWFKNREQEEIFTVEERGRQKRELIRREDELEKQFTPSTEASLSIAEGFVYRAIHGEIECTLDKNGKSLQFVTGYEWIPLSHHGRVLFECRECHRAVGKQFEVCNAGHLICSEHTARCGHPACSVLTCWQCTADFFDVCSVSSVYICAEHRKSCPSCGNQILIDLFFSVEEAEQEVCPDCFEICEETNKSHLIGELGQSDISGKLVHHALLITCPLTGKRGLVSEMELETGSDVLYAPEALVTCAVTGSRVTPDKVGSSEISGKPCLREHLQRCAVSGALALPEELAECEETGQKVDPRLLATCWVSGKQVFKELLLPSPVSGHLFLPRLGAVDEETGEQCLPDEMKKSVISGKRVRRDRLVASEWSGRPALPEETARCEISNELLLRDEGIRCEETNRLLSPRLIEIDQLSGKKVHKELLVTCHVTNKKTLRRLMEPSIVSGRLGLRHLMERDDGDGGYVLPEELKTCSVSGKRVAPNKLRKSDISDREALLEEMSVCSETGKRVCPDELLACQETGIQAVPECFGIDEVTGQRVLKRLLVTCSVTTKKTLPKNTKECVLTGRRALTSECEQCTATGQWVIRGRLEASGVSGKRVLPSLLRTSSVSGIRALPEEMVRCQRTNQFALSEELEECQISGKRVIPGLLRTCPDTGKRFLPEFGKRCAHSGELVHPDALATSDASGLIVRASLLVQSEVSNQRGLSNEMETCAESKKRVLPSELAQCELSKKKVLLSLLSPCAICSRKTIIQRQAQCQGCSGYYCEEELFGRLCGTCRSLTSLPFDFIDILDQELQKAVLTAFPAVGRISTSRNAQYVLVYAKSKITQRWKGSRLLVFRVKNGVYTLVKENPEFRIF